MSFYQNCHDSTVALLQVYYIEMSYRFCFFGEHLRLIHIHNQVFKQSGILHYYKLWLFHYSTLASQRLSLLFLHFGACAASAAVFLWSVQQQNTLARHKQLQLVGIQRHPHSHHAMTLARGRVKPTC